MEKFYPDLCEKIIDNIIRKIKCCSAQLLVRGIQCTWKDVLEQQVLLWVESRALWLRELFKALLLLHGRKAAEATKKNILLPTKFIPHHFNEEQVFLLNYYMTEITPCGPVHQMTVTK